MARRARDGSTDAATKAHRRASNAEMAAAVVDANLSGGEGGGGAGGGDGDAIGPGGGSSATGASPQAWAKLGYLTYTRDKNSEKMPFPTGMVGLLKAVTDVLNHCVGTGDLAVSPECCITSNGNSWNRTDVSGAVFRERRWSSSHGMYSGPCFLFDTRLVYASPRTLETS